MNQKTNLHIMKTEKLDISLFVQGNSQIAKTRPLLEILINEGWEDQKTFDGKTGYQERGIWPHVVHAGQVRIDQLCYMPSARSVRLGEFLVGWPGSDTIEWLRNSY